ncbi:MAG: hypothetical protein GY737_00220 [Desulfobacteraceae bacterium]|nr:hypothetical protein [Desulfobacteraceae bacterium]
MKLTADLDLNQIVFGDEYDSMETMLGNMIRTELVNAIKKEVKAELKTSPELKRAVKAVQKNVSEQILEALK